MELELVRHVASSDGRIEIVLIRRGDYVIELVELEEAVDDGPRRTMRPTAREA